MKKVIYTIILSLFALLLFAQSPGEKKWKENLVKNRIQSQEQWNYKYVKGKPSKDGYKNFTKKFDLNGNVIEEIYYNAGNIDKKSSYKYDQNDNPIEYVNYKGDESKVMFMQTITYDNSGNKIREERFNGLDYEIIKYTYDPKNKLTEIVRSDVNGKVAHNRVFNYSGNVCHIYIYNNGSEVGKITNTYDSNGNITETIEYDSGGNIKEKYIYVYNGKNLSEKTKYIGEKFTYHENYKYDNSGNLIEIQKEEPKGNVFINNLYKYDSKGNLIEEEWYDNTPDENSKKTYFYNEKGILEKAEVYYALYKYKIQYRYKYTYF